VKKKKSRARLRSGTVHAVRHVTKLWFRTDVQGKTIGEGTRRTKRHKHRGAANRKNEGSHTWVGQMHVNVGKNGDGKRSPSGKRQGTLRGKPRTGGNRNRRKKRRRAEGGRKTESKGKGEDLEATRIGTRQCGTRRGKGKGWKKPEDGWNPERQWPEKKRTKKAVRLTSTAWKDKACAGKDPERDGIHGQRDLARRGERWKTYEGDADASRRLRGKRRGDAEGIGKL